MNNAAIKFCSKIVTDLELDLNGLTVVTECASGYYAYTPVIAALAGAKVYSLGKDTRYGSFESNRKNITEIATKLGIQNNIDCLDINKFTLWREADIVTNSGMLRPLERNIISQLKQTAVIPLMWETWEFRKGEIDLETCQEFGIAVIGTDEHFGPINMYHYPGMLALHLLHNLEADYSADDIVVLGGSLTGSMIVKTLSEFNNNINWFANSIYAGEYEVLNKPYNQINKLLDMNNIDVLLVAEHSFSERLIGSEASVNFNSLKQKFPAMKLAHLCGNIDADELKSSGINFFPNTIASYGYMSILPDMFGPKPTLKLMAGGLKVGEIASRVRINGGIIESAIEQTINYGIGMDFQGGFLNFRL